MIDIYNNRFNSILLQQPTKKYYLASMLFAKWSEEKWVVEKNKYTVKHGCVHVANVIRLICGLFEKCSDEEIENIISPEYLYLLMAAIYAHDVGMQDYYSFTLKHLPANELTKEDYDEVRINHSDIIKNLFSGIKDRSDVEAIFRKCLIKIENMIDPRVDSVSIDEICRLILNTKRQLSLICQFHNNKLSDLSTTINRLRLEGKLILSEKEEKQLILVSALLQLGDTLDMSTGRIDIGEFITRLTKLNTYDGLPSYEPIILNKLFLCYLIDDVRTEDDGKNVHFIFRMSINHNNLTENRAHIDTCKNTYMKRVDRNEDDCVAVVERFLNKKIDIRLAGEEINVDNDKPIVSQAFFDLIDSFKYKTLDNLILDALSAFEDCVFIYVKLYSDVCKTYFGGVATLADDAGKRDLLEQLYFHSEEWNFDTKKQFVYSENNIFDVIKNKRVAVKYADYVGVCKSKKIKSEAYFMLKYDNRIIGMVNVHFDKILTQNEIQAIELKLHKNLAPLGYKIYTYHKEVAAKKFAKLIKSCSTIKSEHSQMLTNMFNRLYGGDLGTYADNIRKISIKDIKEVVGVSNFEVSDNNSYVSLHLESFTDILNSFFSELGRFLDIEKAVVSNNKTTFIKIIIMLDNRKGFISRQDIYKACTYFNSIDIVPQDMTINFSQYVLPLKSYIMLFGGRVVPTIKDDTRFDISLVLPKKDCKVDVLRA